MNRNRLLAAFISHITNMVVHQILEKAIDSPEIAQSYKNEIKNSLTIAKSYRGRIHPLDNALPSHDNREVRDKIIREVRTKLGRRMAKGYDNIDISLIEDFVDKALKDMKVIED